MTFEPAGCPGAAVASAGVPVGPGEAPARRYSDGERPHVRRRKRSKTLVELNPAAADTSLIERSGRVRSNVQAFVVRWRVRQSENVVPVCWRITWARVWG